LAFLICSRRAADDFELGDLDWSPVAWDGTGCLSVFGGLVVDERDFLGTVVDDTFGLPGRALMVLLSLDTLDADGFEAVERFAATGVFGVADFGVWVLEIATGLFESAPPFLSNCEVEATAFVPWGLLTGRPFGRGGILGISSFESDLLLFPVDDCGREFIGLSGLKKLDLRRRFAGEGGIFAIDSTVRSANDGRLGVFGSELMTCESPSGPLSTSLVPLRDGEADADVRPLSSSGAMDSLGFWAEGGGREGLMGRVEGLMGFLKRSSCTVFA
jgi:hypothetical protein